MANTRVTVGMKNTLRAINKLRKAGKRATQDLIAKAMGRSDSAAWSHLKRGEELGLVTKSSRNGKVIPGSYRLTKKGEDALASRS